MKTALIRTDSSFEIGTGHVMRCLTLADVLAGHGVKCHFICRPLAGDINALIRARGHDVIEAQDACAAQVAKLVRELSAELVIVDHYGLDADWERQIKGTRVLVIDDLANRLHHCDMLLDQNLGRTADDYKKLLEKPCKLLIGPHFALLRPEFAQARPASIARRANNDPKTLLLNFGGSDPLGATPLAMRQIEAHCPLWDCITVVLGQSARCFVEVQSIAQEMSSTVEIKVQAHDMAALMAQADVALGAAGSSAWERCCLGLPTGMVTIAENQRAVARALHDAGGAVLVGDLCSSPDLDGIAGFLNSARHDRGFLSEITTKAALLTDGQGTMRVAHALLTGGQEERGAT